MVGPGNPERLEPQHPLPPDEEILQRIDQRVAHVENAGDIRRGDDDAVGLFLRMGIGFEIAPLFPERVPLFLDELWIVGFWQ